MSRLVEFLLDAEKRKDWAAVHVASLAELGEFVPKDSDCHGNARRYSTENPDFQIVEGWIPIGSHIFNRHSVVQRSGGGLICVTLGPVNYPICGLILHPSELYDLPYKDLVPQIIACGVSELGPNLPYDHWTSAREFAKSRG